MKTQYVTDLIKAMERINTAQFPRTVVIYKEEYVAFIDKYIHKIPWRLMEECLNRLWEAEQDR